MMQVFKFIFWVSFGLLVYAHLVYPLLIILISTLKRKPHTKKEQYPSATLIVPFYNEAHIMEKKIANVGELLYPRDKLEVLFVSDGSTDKSADIIKGKINDTITLWELKEHRGKPLAINEALKHARGDIIIFSDASGMMNKEAIKYIVDNFSDENIGAVLGIYRVAKEKSSVLDEAEERYWDFELFLKKRESMIYTTLGGHGSLYAVRKALFEPLAEDIINDDFVIPARISLKGYRTIYEERSILNDVISTGNIQELKRRIRIAYGNWQQIGVLKEIFKARHAFLLWQFISHKIIRTLQGIMIISMLSASIFIRAMLYDIFLLFFGIFFLCSFLGFFSEKWRILKSFHVFSLVFFGICAQVIGTVKFLSGRKISW